MKPFEVVEPRRLIRWADGYILCGGRYYNKQQQMASYFPNGMTEKEIEQKLITCHGLEKKHGLEYAPITYKDLT